MKITGWNGVESVEAEDLDETASISIGSEDSHEEYYDTRSRWLYAMAMGKPEYFSHRNIASNGGPTTLNIACLRPAPTVQFQIRKAKQRIRTVVENLGMHLDIDKIYRSPNVARMVDAVRI